MQESYYKDGIYHAPKGIEAHITKMVLIMPLLRWNTFMIGLTPDKDKRICSEYDMCVCVSFPHMSAYFVS